MQEAYTDSFTYNVTMSGTFVITACVLDEEFEVNREWTIVSTVDNDSPELNYVTKLNQNMPNPFNPTTTISFEMKNEGQAKIDIYNAKGQLVIVLIDGEAKVGLNEIIWNGKDQNNRKVGSGVYFYRLTTKDYSEIKKAIMLK